MSESNVVLFEDEINANASAEFAPTDLARLETEDSMLDTRLRGGYITGLELSSSSTGERHQIFGMDDEQMSAVKPVTSHPTMPAGPSEGVGGQHGPVRKSDMHHFELSQGPEGEQRMSLQMKRSDNGLSFVELNELTSNSLTRHSIIQNPTDQTVETSTGQHDYYLLGSSSEIISAKEAGADEITITAIARQEIEAITVNGLALDQVMGEGAVDFLLTDEDGTLFWRDFNGAATIGFPDGRTIKIAASLTGNTEYQPIIEFWYRKGSDKLAIEPVVGVYDDGDNHGIKIEPYGSAVFTSRVESL